MQSRQNIIDAQSKCINENYEKYEECMNIGNEIQKVLEIRQETKETQT